MLWSFCVLLACQALGELLHTVTGLPVPGTVFGLALLLAGMCLFKHRAGPSLLPAADALLPYLGLFFVPPGVAAVLRLSHLTHAWPGIAAALLVSSFLTLVTAGHTAQTLLAWQARRIRRGTPDFEPNRGSGAMSLDAALKPALAAARPVLPLVGTLLAYEAGLRLHRLFKVNALANPVLLAVILTTAALEWSDNSASDYAAGVQPLAMLLGPATVAPALPVYRCMPRIRETLMPILASVAVGAVTAAVTATVVASSLNVPDLVVRSMATKSATAAIAMAVAPQIGGDASLAAGLSVLTGIIGAITCAWVLDRAGVRDPRARGLATGVAAHGIGTARMLALDTEAGAFSGLAMGLTGLATGIVLPFAYLWLAGHPG